MQYKPRLLDLFCGAGGAAMGYYRAGFEVVGVDIAKQPRYPFTFVQGDALEYAAKYGHQFDVIHASPPCQRNTRLNRIRKIKSSTDANYVDLIPETRALLESLGVPYVIENVEGAALNNPFMLCGSYFSDLLVYRHRFFESSHFVLTPAHTPHNDKTPPAGQGPSPKGFVSITAGGLFNVPEGYTPASYKNMAMGIDWMTQNGLTEAIPPRYTEFIGRQLIAVSTVRTSIA
jgi:DNA (cytosine-5)-methyltransferase 1